MISGGKTDARVNLLRHIGNEKAQHFESTSAEHRFIGRALSLLLRIPGQNTPAPSFSATWIADDQTKNWPPLAEIVEPVMKPASSEARNTTQRAISSGSPRRPTGICGMMRSFSTFSGMARTISVPI